MERSIELVRSTTVHRFADSARESCCRCVYKRVEWWRRSVALKCALLLLPRGRPPVGLLVMRASFLLSEPLLSFLPKLPAVGASEKKGQRRSRRGHLTTGFDELLLDCSRFRAQRERTAEAEEEWRTVTGKGNGRSYSS